MPSGRTHDRITLWTLPVIAGVTYMQTRSGNLTLVVVSGYMFGGLMFGPDLDIFSIHYQRWGWLRWIWLPYQKSLRHRSFLSHGPVIGTTLRIVYLCGVVGIVVLVGAVVVEQLAIARGSWQMVESTVSSSLIRYGREFLALFIGLELGAMSHYVSDWGGSTYKRWQKQGIAGLLSGGKMKKRKKVVTRRSPKTASKISKTTQSRKRS
ncbi:metal-binding protein [Calothrix sp. 336/3]|uniref:metal-binding protein n=1 Tax=Calothrix sp. 336/3 TaxID=1337936 RepID=UPI0004E37F42|nr:metal-binding protein [Calothrix sp. 336/3]AKG22552.1 metal-binding protein [Calothrix sp. 336/3]